MADEGTLGLARAEESVSDEPSKAELQRRLDETRDSISNTVSEIKETVANQVQAVKETLDWREQFKRRPVAWSLGAAGVGFLTGYGIAAALKGDRYDYEGAIDYYGEQSRSYAASPIIGESASRPERDEQVGDEGPSILSRISNSAAYDKVKTEAATVGEQFLHELGNTAKMLIVPAVIKSVKDFLGGYLPNAETAAKAPGDLPRSDQPGYQPKLERNPS